MGYLGDFTPGKTITGKFNTHQATGTPITLAGAPALSVYKDSTTQSTAGVTLTVDYDSLTGLHRFSIDTSADGTFYASGNNFEVVITTGTVDSISVVGTVVGSFSLSNRSAIRPTTADRTLDVSATGEAGIDWANVGSPTTTLALTGTTIATTQQVDVNTIKTNPVVNGGTVTFPTNATLASTTNITAGTITTVTTTATCTTLTNLPAITAGWLTATGIASDAFTAAKFAADCLTAAKIADGAIDAATFAADVDAEILSYLVDDATRIDASALNTATATTIPTNLDAAVSTRATPAQVNSEVDTALADIRLDELLAADSDIDGAAPPTVGSVFHELMTKTTGSFTYDQTTDSLEAVRDRGDAAWVTATGFSTLDAAGVRAAVGLASANLDTQLGTIDSNVDAILVDTGTTLDGKLNTINGVVDAILVDTAEIGAAGAGLTALATQASVNTIDDFLDTEIAAILADTNELQTDWANGGRLDLILDARSSQASVDDLPTNAELATALASADDATLAAIAALNNLSAAQVNAEVDTALADIHLDHLLATTYDPASKPGAADALLNELVESDGGVARYTANALEQGPSGGGGVADWTADERTALRAILGIPASGTTPDDPTTGILDTIRDAVAGVQSDTNDIQTRLPAALVGGRIDANVGAISSDSTAADNAEAFFDGTGYAGTGNVIPTVTTVTNLHASAATAAELAKVPKSDGTATWNATALASINAEADVALADVGLTTTITGRIDAAVTSRMATYTQPTGFLAATFPGTVASTTNITAGTITTATNVTTVNGLAAGVITASSIAADAITDAKVASDVTIASVTGNVGGIAGTTTTLDALQTALNSAHGAGSWATATGFSTLDAAGVRTAVGLASANLDTQLSTIDDFLDTEVAAIKAKTDNLPASPASAGDIPTVSQIWTTALTEAYAADGSTFTGAQAMYMIWSALSEFAIAGTTITCKKLDGVTTSLTFTLDSSSSPTSRARAT